MTAVLEIAGLHKRFGGIVVADDITASLGAGEIVGLIGPNGAGKTSLFNLVTGAVPVEAGSIRLNGAALDGLTMHERARRGLARTWQHIRLFPSLSVLDNLLIAPRLYAGELRERAMAQLAKVRMTEAAGRLPTELSYGKQKLIGLARALMNDGNCLLLDEPMAGVEGPAYDAIKAVIHDEAAAGRAVCVVEHNVSFVKDLCVRAIFMFNGRIVTTGTVEQLLRDPELTELYFGS